MLPSPNSRRARHGVARATLAALLCAAMPGLLAAQESQTVPSSDPRVEVVRQQLEPAGPASVGPVTDLQKVPDSYWAHGSFGDILLHNRKAHFIFGAMPKEGEEANPRRNGVLLDMYVKPSSAENFWLTQPIVSNSNALTLDATAMRTESDPAAGSASVIVEARSRVNPELTVTTRYTLERDRTGLRVTTTVTNTGKEPLKLDGLGDYVNWGAMGAFLPSQGWAQGNSAEMDAEFVFGRYFDAYILFAADTGLMHVVHDRSETRLLFRQNVTLEPGAKEEFTRWFMVVEDTPTLAFGEVLQARPNPNVGVLAGRVTERNRNAAGEIVDQGPAANALVGIRSLRRTDLPEYFNAGKFYILTRTDENGAYSAVLPPGEYIVDIVSPERAFLRGGLGVPLAARKIAPQDHGVSPPARINFEVLDAETRQPIPAKLTLVPLRGTNPLMEGKLGTLWAQDTIYSVTGRGVHNVPAGNYRVVASHGPEYDLAEERVTFRVAEETVVRLELNRAYDAKGWVHADLAVRTNASEDVRTTPEDRVASAVIEGLDFIMTADPGVATDLQPAVDQLNVGDRIRVAKGFRISGEAMPLRGDWLVGPLEWEKLPDFSAAQEAEDGGAVLEALKAAAPEALTLSLRPVFPVIGYLAQQGGTPDTAMTTREGTNLAFDGFEIISGKRQGAFELGFAAWHQALSRGARPVPFASSNSGGTWNDEPGYPRVLIASSATSPDRISVKELVDNFRAGKVQITNGPFIDMTVNGQGPGSTITARPGGEVEVQLSISAPNWSPVTRITTYTNGRFARQVMIPMTGRLPKGGIVFPAADKPDEGKFRLKLMEDSVIQILADSEPTITQDPVNPSVVPTTEQGVLQGQRTLALSPAFFVDVDGDGKVTVREFVAPKPGKDTYEPPF
jgi:hypothetical protein